VKDLVTKQGISTTLDTPFCIFALLVYCSVSSIATCLVLSIPNYQFVGKSSAFFTFQDHCTHDWFTGDGRTDMNRKIEV
jgi:hypothetical protein